MPKKTQNASSEPFYLEGGLPASPEAEKAILGAILLDNYALSQAHEFGLRSDEFSLDANRKLFSAFSRMQAKGKPIDIITAVEHIGKHVTEIGGIAYLSSLTEGLPHRSSIKNYCQIVRAKATLRKLINACQIALADAIEQKEPEHVVAALEASLISMANEGSDQKSTAEVARDVFTRIMRIRAGEVDPLGMQTGIASLDELTGGIHKGEYIVLAGRTGHGKSSLARQIAWAVAKTGKKVKYCSIEMTKENMIECLASPIARVNFEKIRNPRYMANVELERVAEAIRDIRESTLEIDDKAGMDVVELCARIRASIMQGAELIIVDYLQMVGVRGEKDKRVAVSLVSAALRDLAKTTGVPIVALSQLKRPEQGSENREPTLFDLKESGDIENDAFQVWLIYRPKQKSDDTGLWTFTGIDWLLVAKQRNGPVGSVGVVYRGPLLTFDARTENTGNWEEAQRKPKIDFVAGKGYEREHDEESNEPETTEG